MIERYFLLVEGRDDECVFYHLLKHHQISERFKIKNKKGINNLLNTLPTELKDSDLERLGIVVDANTNLEARWTALCNILHRSGNVNTPSVPDDNGTVMILEQPDRSVTVGIWVMPNNQLPGMLEDFTRFLVPDGDSLWVRAADCLDQIPEQDRRFAEQHRSKAHIHTWLAWQEEPGTPLGSAITKRYLDANAPHARQLMDWICRLFDL